MNIALQKAKLMVEAALKKATEDLDAKISSEIKNNYPTVSEKKNEN